MITTNVANVLCPLDGSPDAERALDNAIDAAELFGLPLTLFSAVEDPHLVARQKDYLLAAAGGAEANVEVIVDPHPPGAISARAGDDSLVVMATSTHPLIHHGYLGSAAETIVRDRDIPTLLVGPRASVRLKDVTKTVACCDGSSLSELALQPAEEWADALDCDLWIVSVVEPTYTPADEEPGAETNYVHALARPLGAQWDVLHGTDPARSIAGWAESALLVMTSHGRTGWSRLRMGSVTTATVRWAAGPVLVMRGQAG